MSTSRTALQLIKDAEGFRATAYQCPAGVWTIGFGHTRGVKRNDRCTEAQAEAWLEAEYDEFQAGVRRLVHVPITANQLGALTSFAYNLGLANLASSTLLKKLNAGNYAGCVTEFGKWTHGGGRVLPGLVKRRAAEARLFLS